MYLVSTLGVAVSDTEKNMTAMRRRNLTENEEGEEMTMMIIVGRSLNKNQEVGKTGLRNYRKTFS